MVILPAKFSELSKAWSSLAYSTSSSSTYSSPGSTQGKNTSNGTTINHGAMHKQHDAIHGMICKTWYAIHMRAPEGKEWTRYQLGKTSMPLERWDDFGWNRYKDHRIRVHGLQLTSKTRYDANCLKQQHGHLDAWFKYATAPKHEQWIHWSELHVKLYNTWTLSYCYNSLEQVSNSMAKMQMTTVLADLVKISSMAKTNSCRHVYKLD